jgi:predicted HD phosphohydrolase
LLAALLHDVGKAIDPSDHVGAALQALEGSITERTVWLIAHHMEAQALRTGALGMKARMRIQGSEYYEDLMLVAELDRRGRVPGAIVCELEEALTAIRELAEQEQDA